MEDLREISVEKEEIPVMEETMKDIDEDKMGIPLFLICKSRGIFSSLLSRYILFDAW